MKNRPFVLNTHGSLLGFQNYLPSPAQRLPYHIYDAITLKTSAKRAQAVIVSSKLEYEDALKFGIAKEKIHVIPMGIDIEEIKKEQCESNQLQLLFVGRIARVRRIELILQAVSQLNIPFHLTIAGGEEKTSSVTRRGYLDELKQLSKQLNLESKVSFTGKKNPVELKPIYQSADIFVYPSLYENFGQPLLEAASNGLPLVSTPVGIARDIVIDGETGYQVSGKPDEIKDRIELLKDTNTRLRMGRRIQHEIKNRFNWTHIMDQYIDLYQSL
ncbi:MAG: glycosyltransferase family 4 protein [Nitrospinae bacterium]|nr:glycosyltransferase family 4 protein [Nitrospinota bacterium]MZH13939.1 glycosyltransferase family 4 protein [Nitrospinota bacterium]